MREALGDAMAGPERALPRYCWRKPPLNNDGRGRWQLPIPPACIGQAEKHGDRKKKNPNHNPWPHSLNIFEPLYWFWASIEWYSSDPTTAAGDDITMTSFAELFIAFQFSQFVTGINP